MAETSIEWADRAWNFLAGCSVVSPGCTNCYAMKQAARIERMNPGLEHYRGLTKPSKAGPVWTGKIGIAEHKLTEPLRVKKPQRWFVNSMSDLFHDDVPDEVIDRAFAVMALAPHHTFQVLTKRSKRMREYLAAIDAEFHASPDDLNERFGEHCVQASGDPCAAGWFEDHVNWPLPNVWLGVSVEDQARADQRIPDLLATPAAVRWISAEPLLGPVNLQALDLGEIATNGYGMRRFERDALSPWLTSIPASHGCKPSEKEAAPQMASSGHARLDWVVVGGESGPDARPMHPDWCRDLRDQCAAVGVPFFFKQWGEWRPPVTEQEAYDTSKGRAGNPPAFIQSLDGTVHCYHGPHIVSGKVVLKIGKNRAGRLLDGRTHDDMPRSTITPARG